MTTTDLDTSQERDKLAANLARIEVLTARLAAALSRKHTVRSSLQAPGPELYGKAVGAFWAEMMQNPTRLWQSQLDYWGKTLAQAVAASEALLDDDGRLVPGDDTPEDPRFANPLWQTHPWFNYLKKQYFIASEAMQKTVDDLAGLSDQERERLQYFTGQIIDMMAPTNFLASNPDALEKAVETEGQSLIDGLENMIRDLERNNGELIPTLSDPEAFKVGENLATTEGAVVFRNRLFELIQYAPRTETVHQTPLLIFPPWINKFYILDLRPDNSLIRWIVDQGYTLFVVSWVNPADPSYAETGMEAYVDEGFLTAIRETKAITGQDKINVVGYCIAGTTLALTLALMQKRGDESVANATFFTALTDFTEPGEVGMFLDNDFVDGIEEEARETGLMSALFMSRTFSFLRANDLIYTPAINAYLLGKPPPAFDLLYWNGDSTNLPGRMAVEYLRGLCQKNAFAGAGDGFELFGERLKASDITLPLCAVACESDHIAPWRSSYTGFAKMGSADKTFLLSQSGHIAGIVNPPSKKKYGHYTNDAWPASADEWREGATFHPGTWWFRWGEWLAARSGPMVPARTPGGPDHPPLAPAPGTYVTARAEI